MQKSDPSRDRLGLAILVIIFTTLALSFGDALIRDGAGNVSLWQIFVLRSAVALPGFALMFVIFARGFSLWPVAPGWMALRVGMLLGMWVAYYAALPHLPFSVAAAAYYTLPIFMTLFSALLTNARIGRLGWGSVVIGFVGVVIILRPGPEGMNGYVVLPLLSAVLYALAMILTRTKCRGEHAVVLGFWLNAGFLISGTVASLLVEGLSTGETAGFLLSGWSPLDAEGWIVIGILALALLIGSIGAAIAYQNGPPQIIGVFDFSYVGFAVIWGLILFLEVPDMLTLLGIGAIVLAGVMAVRD